MVGNTNPEFADLGLLSLKIVLSSQTSCFSIVDTTCLPVRLHKFAIVLTNWRLWDMDASLLNVVVMRTFYINDLVCQTYGHLKYKFCCL